MSGPWAGADLPMLLLAGYRSLVDESMAEFSRRGYDDARPVHGISLRAIAAGADSGAELARRMGVSKQAAAKTIAALRERGYVDREPDPTDGRRKPLVVTERGFELLRAADETFELLRERWANQIGDDQLEAMLVNLDKLAGDQLPNLDTPGWIARDLETPA
jgi:DNA-binding MarR family transcriptional regulator